MKIPGRKMEVTPEHVPLVVSGAINVTGGSVVQFTDGINYYPNREGTPSSPILITHNVSVSNELGEIVPVSFTTLFYENDVLITSDTPGYTLNGNSLLVAKNIEYSTMVDIKAISKFVESNTNKVYEQHDFVTLRTLLKAEPQYHLTLSQRGAVFFDGHRNPNTKTNIVVQLKLGNESVTDLTGITFKWLNSAGIDAIENELYADEVSTDGSTLAVDKTYIDHEVIRCEVWKDNEMIAEDMVTFVRKFYPYTPTIQIPQIPLQEGVERLDLILKITDTIGNVDVDSAFLVEWMVVEGATTRKIATGAQTSVPVSCINLNAANLEIYPDVKRREAYGALTVMDAGEEALLTDDLGNVLTVEMYSL